MLKTDIELLKEIYNETIPDYMNPGLDLFGKNDHFCKKNLMPLVLDGGLWLRVWCRF
jgi:hypothetical protein